jgi:hypothetical protein
VSDPLLMHGAAVLAVAQGEHSNLTQIWFTTYFSYISFYNIVLVCVRFFIKYVQNFVSNSNLPAMVIIWSKYGFNIQ